MGGRGKQTSPPPQSINYPEGNYVAHNNPLFFVNQEFNYKLFFESYLRHINYNQVQFCCLWYTDSFQFLLQGIHFFKKNKKHLIHQCMQHRNSQKQSKSPKTISPALDIQYPILKPSLSFNFISKYIIFLFYQDPNYWTKKKKRE